MRIKHPILCINCARHTIEDGVHMCVIPTPDSIDLVDGSTKANPPQRNTCHKERADFTGCGSGGSYYRPKEDLSTRSE